MRAAPGMSTASTVRDAPSVCPTSLSLPREETSSAPTVATSSDGEPGHGLKAVYAVIKFLFVCFIFALGPESSFQYCVYSLCDGTLRPKCNLCPLLKVFSDAAC